MTATTPAAPPGPPPAGAPPPGARPRRRLRYVVAAVVCVGAIVALLVVGLRGNVVYFRTVSEAVAARPGDGTQRFRLGGDVIPSSVTERSDGSISFRVTDGRSTVTVVHRGEEPALFRHNVERGRAVPVVCEGRWGAGRTFDSDRILVNHGNDYEPQRKNFGS